MYKLHELKPLVFSKERCNRAICHVYSDASGNDFPNIKKPSDVESHDLWIGGFAIIPTGSGMRPVALKSKLKSLPAWWTSQGASILQMEMFAAL